MLTPHPEALVRDPSPPPVDTDASTPAGRNASPAPHAAATRTTPTSPGPAPVYLSARVPRALRDEVQHQAIREGRTAAQIVQDAVRSYLDQHAPS